MYDGHIGTIVARSSSMPFVGVFLLLLLEEGKLKETARGEEGEKKRERNKEQGVPHFCLMRNSKLCYK